MSRIDSFPPEMLLEILEHAVEGVTYKERTSTLGSLALVRKDWTLTAQRSLCREKDLIGALDGESRPVHDPRVRMFASSRVTLGGMMDTRILRLQSLLKVDAEQVIVACHGLQELSMSCIMEINFKKLEISSMAGEKASRDALLLLLSS